MSKMLILTWLPLWELRKAPKNYYFTIRTMVGVEEASTHGRDRGYPWSGPPLPAFTL